MLSKHENMAEEEEYFDPSFLAQEKNLDTKKCWWGQCFDLRHAKQILQTWQKLQIDDEKTNSKNYTVHNEESRKNKTIQI